MGGPSNADTLWRGRLTENREFRDERVMSGCYRDAMGTRVPSARDASPKHLGRLSDFDVLQRLRKRDVASLRELHRRHAGFVNAIALRVLGRTEESEEVVQDVFIHLWTHGFELDEQRARFRSWLFVVARNRAIDRRRLMARGDPGTNRARASIRSLVGGPEEASESSDEASLHQAERERVNEGMAALTEPERAIIELAFYDGYTHTEIAGELHAPLEDVKERLRGAMENLHRLLRASADSTEAQPDAGISSNVSGDSFAESRSLECMAAAFALGALDGEERSGFEARLFLGDAALWRRVRELASTTDGLVSRIGSRDLAAASVSQLEERMTAEGFLRSHPDEDFDGGLSWRRRLVVLAAVLGAAFLAGTTLWLDAERRNLRSALAVSEQGRAELGRDLADLKEKISEAEFQKRQVEISLASSEDALVAVMRPSGRELRLRPSSKDLEVISRAFVDGETKRIWVSIDALPELPPEQTYQLWVFVDDESIDGVVFSAQEGAIQVEAVGPPPNTGKLKVAVTIEPAGGSILPAGPIILSGS